MISQCTRRSEDMTFMRDIVSSVSFPTKYINDPNHSVEIITQAMTDINTVLAEAAARDAKSSKALGFAASCPILSLGLENSQDHLEVAYSMGT